MSPRVGPGRVPRLAWVEKGRIGMPGWRPSAGLGQEGGLERRMECQGSAGARMCELESWIERISVLGQAERGEVDGALGRASRLGQS